MMNKPFERTQKSGNTRSMLEPVHPTKRQSFVYNIVFFALGIAAVGMGLLIYWALSGKDALTASNAPFPVKPIVVKSEEVIHVTANICKLTDVSGTVYSRLVSDKTELVAPTVKEGLGKQCYNDLSFDVPIPPQTPPGKYHVNYRIDYQTNPLTVVREEFNTQEFEVVE